MRYKIGDKVVVHLNLKKHSGVIICISDEYYGVEFLERIGGYTHSLGGILSTDRGRWYEEFEIKLIEEEITGVLTIGDDI